MSTQPAQQLSLALAKRRQYRGELYQFFLSNIGKRYASYKLHLPRSLGGYGSAVRTRISEINLDPTSEIRIENTVEVDEVGNEHSMYWATRRAQ